MGRYGSVYNASPGIRNKFRWDNGLPKRGRVAQPDSSLDGTKSRAYPSSLSTSRMAASILWEPWPEIFTHSVRARSAPAQTAASSIREWTLHPAVRLARTED